MEPFSPEEAEEFTLLVDTMYHAKMFTDDPTKEDIVKLISLLETNTNDVSKRVIIRLKKKLAQKEVE